MRELAMIVGAGPGLSASLARQCAREGMKVVLATARLDHDPSNNRPGNLKALCQRCHLRHDRKEHRRRARITVLKRRALGDLLNGPYPD